MATIQTDIDRHVAAGTIGTARRVTPGAAAVNNATALAQGRYLLIVEVGQVRVVGPVAETTSATATDHLLSAGESWTFYCGSTAAEQFVSVIREAAGAIFTVSGADPHTTAQPPDWT